MPDYPCRYIIARFFRNPVREEARNFGILLQCEALNYVRAKFDGDLDRLSWHDADRTVLTSYIDHFTRIDSSHLGRGLLMPDMYQEMYPELNPQYLPKLAATARGNIQFTEPRGCVTDDPEKTLTELYDLLVLPEDDPIPLGW